LKKMNNTHKLQQKICWLYDDWDSISWKRRDISLCHYSPPWRCRQKTTSKRSQLSTELHYVINHKTADINCTACTGTPLVRREPVFRLLLVSSNLPLSIPTTLKDSWMIHCSQHVWILS
jgi:hypothetical protein